MEIFGYEISKKLKKTEQEFVSPVPKLNDEGGSTVTVGGGYYGQYVDLSGTTTVSDHELI